jgi:uncharacterized protein YgbK (DUF1537 family)
LSYAQTNNGLKMIDLDAGCLIKDEAMVAAELEKAHANLRSGIESGHNMALVVRASREEVAATQQLGAALNLSASQVAHRIVVGLAQVSRRHDWDGQISGIVATGGDTSKALCKTLGAQALEILGEVEAGIPILRVMGEQTLPLVTKAGGFGSPAAMADALGKVKQYA